VVIAGLLKTGTKQWIGNNAKIGRKKRPDESKQANSGRSVGKSEQEIVRVCLIYRGEAICGRRGDLLHAFSELAFREGNVRQRLICIDKF
jgi:hypothetical protein